ncbi:MAG: redoxin family protein [Mucilaginibacter sp.]|nr:redoxin family protein [Mucilaginibacter sp.]
MKKLFIAALICCSGYAQAQKVSPLAIEDKKMDAYLRNRKPATLTVQINNLPDSVKKVDIKYTLVQIGGPLQVTKHAETDATGAAKIVLDQNLPYQQIWLKAGEYLYAGIYVNTGLTVNIDARLIPNDGAYMIGEGVTYSGNDGEFNTVMNENTMFKKAERGSLYDKLRALGGSRNMYDADKFTLKTDSVLIQLGKLDDEFIAGHPKYSKAVKNETLSQFYGNICVAYWNGNMPATVFDRLNVHVPLFTSNDGILYYQYLGIYTASRKRFKKEEALKGKLMLFDSLYTPQRSDVLKLILLEQEKDNYKLSYPAIINSLKTGWCKKIAAAELARVDANQKRVDSLFALSKKLDKSDIGTPLLQLPFDASLYQLDTLANVDNFLRSLRSKFPNKALVIDFWATWCAPCIADMPYSKNLHQNNKDLPVEYIYLCTSSGSNINTWKNRIGDLGIPGTHIFVNDKIIDKLKSALNASSGFPAYVVTDVNGKIRLSGITSIGGLDKESLKKAVGL